MIRSTKPCPHHGLPSFEKSSRRCQSQETFRDFHDPYTHAAAFITQFDKFTSYSVTNEPKHKIFFYEAAKIREILAKHKCNIADSFLMSPTPSREYADRIARLDLRKLELHIRSRWATVITILKEIIYKNQGKTMMSKHRLLQAVVAKCKDKVKEKIIFEIMNPSLAKVLRSKTPPSDAPRQLRENWRKENPVNEEADYFPEIVFQFKGKGEIEGRKMGIEEEKLKKEKEGIKMSRTVSEGEHAAAEEEKKSPTPVI